MSDESGYEQRDARIRKLLRSKVRSERKQGMKLLDEALRERVARKLTALARGGRSAALVRLLKPGLTQLDRDKFNDIWEETLVSVWKNVVAGKIGKDGSLMSYVLTIARRRTSDWWRKRSKERLRSEWESVARPSPDESDDELLIRIETFKSSLSERDQVILEYGLALTMEMGSKHGYSAVLVEWLKETYAEKGWFFGSDDAVVRKYGRLRARLRNFLEGGGDRDD